MSAKFSEFVAPAPSYEDVSAQLTRIQDAFSQASDEAGRQHVIAEWEQVRRGLDSWTSLTHLRFNQDTRSDEYRKAREFCDEITPKLTELDVRFKRQLLESEHRPELERRYGPQAFALWDANARAFDPAIKSDLVEEAKLEAEYVELLASARFEFDGKTYTLPEMRRFAEHRDRDVRHRSLHERWAWFQQRGDTLDRIFAELTRLRTTMAKTVGLETFTDLGYLRMCRIDYGEDEVACFREQVCQQVVPLCMEIKRAQARRLGLERLHYWDDLVHDRRGNPAPLGDHDWLLGRAQEMFDQMGGGLGEFFAMMQGRELLDLKSREGKAGGGFCTSIPVYGVPFIFANFNGTKGDVEVFTHEAGHAFQGYKSNDLALYDYLHPTTESCEIHSMSLEFLTWPYMGLFFGDDAERFRSIHLAESLLFLPYGVAVDHFQHEVYRNPEASPQERHAMWQEMERTYLPWRDYGDLEYPSRGGFWQTQRHIYLAPFYYIDYSLALCCALQFWVRAQQDPEGTLGTYVELCSRGGEVPFRELVRGIGLRTPFENGCLDDVIAHGREHLVRSGWIDGSRSVPE